VDRPAAGAAAPGRRRQTVRAATGARRDELRQRAAGLAARARRPAARSGRPLARDGTGGADAGDRGHDRLRAARPDRDTAAARRLPPGQYPLDAGPGPAFRRPRRQPQRTGGAGPLDAAERRPAAAAAPARRPARRLRDDARVRPARTGTDRAVAHAAPAALQRLAGAALERSDLPDQLPLVRQPTGRNRPPSCGSRSRRCSKRRWWPEPGRRLSCAHASAAARRRLRARATGARARTATPRAAGPGAPPARTAS